MTAFRISETVQAALLARAPVVALESTLITHGLPYPENANVACALEQRVLDENAKPATIAVIDGNVRVGLSHAELNYLAQEEAALKLSTRDLAIAKASKRTGGTTVAATLRLAHAAGISVFATGGIGGVHRGCEYDVSADLASLAEIPMLVVCSGAKAILDLERTREWLETSGVPVVGYQTKSMPAFYSQHSSLSVDYAVDDAEEAAAIFVRQLELGLPQAVLLVVPVPETAALAAEEAEQAIVQAVREAEEQKIRGKLLTPFLLDRIVAITEGRSLEANRALLENNAKLAAQVAYCIADA